MAESDKYYHYTSKEGLTGILEAGEILPSVDTKTDTMMGKGVYLTGKDPSTPTAKLLYNNYDSTTAAANPEKVDYYIKFDANDLGKVKKHDGKRDVIVKPGGGLKLTKAEAVGMRHADGSYVEHNLKN